MISAAMPEGIVRSAITTRPLPPPTSAIPTIAAALHCGRPGRSPRVSPRRIVTAYSTAPAIANRAPAAISGGRVSLDTRIARYVVPQMTYTADSAVQMRAGEARPPPCWPVPVIPAP